MLCAAFASAGLAGASVRAEQSGASEAMKLEGHGGPVKGLASLSGGDEALSASFDYALGLWDLTAGAKIAWLDGHEAAVNAVATTPDDRYALSASDDFTLILWDLEALKRGDAALAARLTGHEGKVAGVAISADGTKAASAGWDGLALIWSLPDGALLARTEPHGAAVTAVAFAPDGSAIVTGSADGRVRRWRAQDGAAIDTLAEHGFAISSLTVAPSASREDWIAFGGADGVVRILSASGEDEGRFEGERTPIMALATDASGKRLAVGDGKGGIALYARSGEGAGAKWAEIKRFKGALHGPVWALSFAGNERLLAAGLDPVVAVWPLIGPAAPPPVLSAGERPSFQVDPSQVSNGERQFQRKCSVCHTLTPDGGRKAGPTLYGLFGRRAGSVKGYAYSSALTGLDLIWTEETLDALFDLGPEHYTPGSKMPMQRITRAEDRADLVAYLVEATQPSAAAQ